MNIEETLKRAEKVSEELSAIIKELQSKEVEKAWPDTFEEAISHSSYWGFCINGHKFIIVTEGRSSGLAIAAKNTWTYNLELMYKYWKGNGIDSTFGKYYFKSFYTAKELYLWMAEE